VPYKAKATVFFNNKSHSCNIINLSRKGALLTSPVDAEPGNYLRLNLRLPGMDSLIDLDAIMVRESQSRPDAWAVSFCQLSDRACGQLHEYIDGIIEQHAERKKLEEEKKERAARAQSNKRKRKVKDVSGSVSASMSGSGDWQDWKSLQEAVEERMKKVTQKIAPVKPLPEKPVEAVRTKKDTHEEFEESLGSLDDIYRDALHSIARDKRKRPKSK